MKIANIIAAIKDVLMNHRKAVIKSRCIVSQAGVADMPDPCLTCKNQYCPCHCEQKSKEMEG